MRLKTTLDDRCPCLLSLFFVASIAACGKGAESTTADDGAMGMGSSNASPDGGPPGVNASGSTSPAASSSAATPSSSGASGGRDAASATGSGGSSGSGDSSSDGGGSTGPNDSQSSAGSSDSNDGGSATSSDSGACGASEAGARPLPWPAANKILCETVVPTFPGKTCTVTDVAYGAKGDGTTDNTDSIKKAIADCALAGGGHVVFPSGTYVTGAIELLDGIDLHLEAGAVVKFSGDVTKYPLVLTRYEGIELMNHSPMIYAYRRTNIGVTGPGVLDASGTATWNTGANRAPLEAYANSNTPVSQRAANGCCRSTFVEPYSCKNVLIQGITLQGANFWQIHPTLSTNVTVDNVNVTNSHRTNNDGFDPESSDHVVLSNSTIQANDDAMAIKSGRDADGRRINVPTSNFVFMHDRFASTVGLMTLGSELTGGIHDVYGFDLTTVGKVTYVFQIKGNTQRGGTVNDVHMDTVAITNGVTGGVINSDMHYMGQTGPYNPMYGNFSISNAKIDGAPFVLHLGGVSAADPIGTVVMENSTYTNIANPTNTEQFVTVTWNNVTINGQPAH